MTAVCASAYAASLMTMLGTCYILSKTSLSPANVQTMTTIYNTVSAGIGCEAIVESDEDVTDVDVVSSLIVATLSSTDSHDSQVSHEPISFYTKYSFLKWGAPSVGVLFEDDVLLCFSRLKIIYPS